MDSVLIIPTLNPNEKLILLIEELKKLSINNIVVVDDGSNSSSTYIFNTLKDEGCKVIHHDHNIGKGRAIKDGIIYATKSYPSISGYITADSDYQHLPQDIKKVAVELEKNKNNIVLGERNFSNKIVPIRSKIGNSFSSAFFKAQTGVALEDTQTGLRGIPIKYTELAISTIGDRYDYEMNFLTNAAMNKINFTKIPIITVYENNNKSSHFRTITDSILIYKELAKFAIIAILSASIDVSLFTMMDYLLQFNDFAKAIISTVVARCTSGLFNFYANSRWSFRSREKIQNQAYKYLILFLMQMVISSMAVSILSNLPINITLIKIVVDLIIFMVNYFVEKRFIFI